MSPKPDLSYFKSPYFFFSTDEETTVLYVSPSVEQVLGYKEQELVGRRGLDFIDTNHPLNADLRRPDQIPLKTTETKKTIRVIKDADGNSKVIEIQSYGTRDSGGRVVTRCGICQDVTNSYVSEGEINNRLLELKQIEATLSEREATVLDRVLKGHMNKSIAAELSISNRAVERIRARVTTKFSAKTTAELVSKATELRLLSQLAASAGRLNAGTTASAPQAASGVSPTANTAAPDAATQTTTQHPREAFKKPMSNRMVDLPQNSFDQ